MRALASGVLLVYRHSAALASGLLLERSVMPTSQKIVWAILMLGLAGVLYMAFRGYLAPAFLLDFANAMLC